MKKIFGIILGLVLILGGGIYALDVLGITHINISFDGWWTLFIIVPCLGGLFFNDRGKAGNLIGLAIGIFLLLGARDIVPYDVLWKLILPIIVVVIGINIVVKAICGNDINNDAEIHTEPVRDENIIKAGAIFSGTRCDITDSENVEQVDVCCIFGGATVIVPADVKIKINTFSLFGGVSDKRALRNIDENSRIVTINGFCMFGGVDII